MSDMISDRRRQTRNRVYRCLYDSPVPMSKQELALELELSLPTLYQNLNELLELGLIEYAGAQSSSGGRPAMQLRVVSGARFAIGVLITRQHIHFALTDLKCEMLGYRDCSHDFKLLSREYNSFLASELEKFIDENGVDRSKLLGVGICLAGIIVSESNTVFYAPTLNLRNTSMQALIDAIPYPTHLENDASSGGFAEWFFQHNSESLAFLSLAEGVGGAVFVNGGRYEGSNERSGEFGHMCVERNGLPCTCGRRGCLEAYCSSSRLSRDLGMSLDEFFRRIDDGSHRAIELWEDYLTHLALGINNIRMALDCSVVLGGQMAEFIVPYLPRLKELVSECDPFSNNADYLRIDHSSGKGAILGAALYYVKEFLEKFI